MALFSFHVERLIISLPLKSIPYFSNSWGMDLNMDLLRNDVSQLRKFHEIFCLLHSQTKLATSPILLFTICEIAKIQSKVCSSSMAHLLALQTFFLVPREHPVVSP